MTITNSMNIPFISSSIRNMLMAIISSVVLLSVLLLTYIVLEIFESDMTGMVNLTVSRTTKLLGDKVDTEMSNRIRDLQLIDTLSRDNNQLIYKNFITENSDILYVANIKFDANKNIVEQHALPNTKFLKELGLSVATIQKAHSKIKVLFERAARGEIIVKNISPLFNRPVWILAIKQAESQNILVAYYDSEHLTRLFTSSKMKNAKQMNRLVISFLIDNSKTVVVHPNKDLLLNAANLSGQAIADEMYHSNVLHGFKEFEVKEQTYYGSYQRIDIGDLGVITLVNKDKALEGVKIARIRALLISLIIISVVFIFVWFFSKGLTERLKRLVRATKNIQKGDYDSRLVVKSQDEIGELTEAFNTMATGLEERERLKGAFGQFVNEEIANQVLSGKIKLGGEMKRATVFFSDIRSFTPISEGLSPQEIVEFLNQYMTLMVDIIHKKDGSVDKFIGDAIMALWGAPVSKGEKKDAQNAVLAALMMRDAVIKFNKNRGSKKKPYINIGCGLNSGPLLAGQIGSNDKLEYTVIGDAVNLASRVESLCKSFGVDLLITEYTYSLVKDIVTCTPMQKISVKGKTGKQQTYTVLGKKNDSKSPKSIKELRTMLNIKQTKKGRVVSFEYPLYKK